MKSKVLLMGKSGSGKTSMRSIIFANYLAIGTQRLLPTLDVEHNYVRFLGSLVLNLWDCGGQDRFMENYFKSQRDHIFHNVEVLIYVFDVTSKELQKDLEYFHECLDAIRSMSPDAKIFCLIHKMDLIPTQAARNETFEQRTSELRSVASDLTIDCFQTSIWDESLYNAWSSIVYSLVPNVSGLERRLRDFCQICDADEAVLFEKATFLVISQHVVKNHWDRHRFEKISNIVKQFKLSCRNTQTQFDNVEIRNTNFNAFISSFTSTTFILLVMSDTRIQPAATFINIEAAKPVFESLLQN